MCIELQMPIGCTDVMNSSSSVPVVDLLTEMSRYAVYYASKLALPRRVRCEVLGKRCVVTYWK